MARTTASELICWWRQSSLWWVSVLGQSREVGSAHAQGRGLGCTQMERKRSLLTLGILLWRRNKLWNRSSLLIPEINPASLFSPEWTKGKGLDPSCGDPQSLDGLKPWQAHTACLAGQSAEQRGRWKGKSTWIQDYQVLVLDLSLRHHVTMDTLIHFSRNWLPSSKMSGRQSKNGPKN